MPKKHENKAIQAINLNNFAERFTYSADKDPEDKIVMSAGSFATTLATLKLCDEIRALKEKING